MRIGMVVGGVLGIALLGSFTGMALAADEPIAAPTNSETCFAALEKIALAAEAKDLDKTLVDKVGALLTTLDGQCNDSKIVEATKTIADLEAVLK